MTSGYAPVNDQTRIAFTSAAAVPACGVVEAVGADSFAGQLRLKVAVNQSMGEGPLFINGPNSVAAGGHGVCSMATSVPQWALWDEQQTAGPSCGVQMGPAKNSFILSKGLPGYIALGHTIGNRTLVVRKLTAMLGKLDTALSVGGSATVSIWQFVDSAAGSDTGQNMTAWDHFLNSGSLLAGTKVKVEWIAGRWFVTAARC